MRRTVQQVWSELLGESLPLPVEALTESELEGIRDAATDADAAYNLGVALWNHDRLRAAVRCFAFAADSGDEEARLTLGCSRLWIGEVEQAIATLSVLAGSDAGNRDVAAGYLARALLRRSPSDEVLPLLERAAAVEAEFVADLAHELVRVGRTPDAVELLRQASDGGNIFAPIVLGNIHEEAGDLESAEACFRRGAELGDAHSEYNLARLLWMCGREAEATVWLRSAAGKGDELAIARLEALGL